MNASLHFLEHLEGVIRDRIRSKDGSSYTAALVAAGERRIAQKVGEEAVELALAAVAGTRDEQLGEAADLIYHVLVMLAAKDLVFADVVDVLERRHSG